MKHFAAIDVGSNAIRLAICKINGGGRLKTVKTMREPVRLGADVFAKGRISKENLDRMVRAFAQFRKLIDENNVTQFKAVATSAVREASNKHLLLERLRDEVDVNLVVIDAIEEGRLIHLAVSSALDLKNKTALLMDIGGGSVEFVLSSNGKILKVDSFKIGTVRTLLNQQGGLKSEASLRESIFRHERKLKNFLQGNSRPVDIVVGTGGNIVCLGHLRKELLGKKNSMHIKRPDVPRIIERLLDLGYQGRLKYLKMRPDRADVILPAAYLVEMLFNNIPGEVLQIPDVGLKDGVLHDLAGTLARASI